MFALGLKVSEHVKSFVDCKVSGGYISANHICICCCHAQPGRNPYCTLHTTTNGKKKNRKMEKGEM